METIRGNEQGMVGTAQVTSVIPTTKRAAGDPQKFLAVTFSLV